MGIEVVERIQRQMVVDLTDLDEDQQARLEQSVNDLLRRMIAGDEEAAVAGWTSSALNEALARLERDGAHVQAEAIKEALRHNGYVTRDRVFKLGRYAKGRSLRGFTRPANRIVGDMRTEGLIPDTATDLLTSSYQDGVKADGFSVDARLASLLD